MRRIKYIITCISFICLLLFQSCATILNGTQDTIKINTKPQGAKVEINGVSRGSTPVEVTLPRALWQGSTAVITMKGYETKAVKLKRKLNFVTLINILNPFGFIVDLITGSITKFAPEYNIELEKEK